LPIWLSSTIVSPIQSHPFNRLNAS
jgi:hypothetical protein